MKSVGKSCVWKVKDKQFYYLITVAPTKMAVVPTELLALVQDFKHFTKSQKTLREENFSQRLSIEPIVQIETDLEDDIRSDLHRIDLELQQKNRTVHLIKSNTGSLLKDAELAQSLLKIETPFSPSPFTNNENQINNPSARNYFLAMIDRFEQQMESYSKSIKDLELHLDKLNKSYTPEELIVMMRKQHETLIALASEVYLVHKEINNLKKQNKKESEGLHKL